MRPRARIFYLRVVYVAAALLLLAAVGLVIAAHWPRADAPTEADVSADSTSVSASPAAIISVETSSTGIAPPTSATTTSSTSTTVAPPTSTTVGASDPGFDSDLAMDHIRALAEGIGPRVSGTAAEDTAIGYAAEYLEGLGYGVMITEVPLPNGRVSHNVQAVKIGTSDRVIVVGGHIDSVAGAPGANDNASGSAVVLELARCLRDRQTAATIEFVLFGAEEMIDSDRDHHHYGSRQFVQQMTPTERSQVVGMISVDMVAYGTAFFVRNMKQGPQELTNMLLDFSAANGYGATFMKDLGPYGWSDHEPFELAGYPVAWVEWYRDPDYHTSGDNWNHVKSRGKLVERAGEMVFRFLLGLSVADLQSLADARELD